MTDRRPVPVLEGSGNGLSASRRTELYREHRPAVFDLLVRRLRNVEEAEALAQDALLRAFDAAQREPIRNFAAFVLRIASNLAVDALRRRKLEPRAEDPEDLPAEETRHERLDLFRLRGLVDELDPDLREVVDLRYGEGCSFAEIAERLHMSKNGVFARHERALDALRAALRPRRS